MSEETKPEGPQEPRVDNEGRDLEPQGEPGGGSKWGYIIVGVLVLGLLVAIYVRQVVSSGRETDVLSGTPPENVTVEGQGQPAPGTPSGQAPGGTAPAQPLSESDKYRDAVLKAQAVAAQGLYEVGDKLYMVANQPEVGQQGAGATAQIVRVPGKMFDVTHMAGAVRPESLFRRGLFFEGQVGLMNADSLPVLGETEKLMPAVGPVSAATKLIDAEMVIGLEVGGEARAYPIRFMNYHEVVNDSLGGTPVVVTWSSLALAPAAMDRRIDGKELHFGTAGLAYHGAIVLFDDETRGLWTPITAKCLAGAYADRSSNPLQTIWTTWKAWRTMHPTSSVLLGPNPEIPQIDYAKNPQLPSADYRTTTELVYPVEGFDIEQKSLITKDVVFGVAVDGKYRAYPEKTLAEKKEIKDTVGGKEITITYQPDDAGTGFALAKDAPGNPVLCQRLYWIVWKGFHPTTDIHGVVEPPTRATTPGAGGSTTEAAPPY